MKMIFWFFLLISPVKLLAEDIGQTDYEQLIIRPVSETALTSPSGQTVKYYWPNKPWQANTLTKEECPYMSMDYFFQVIKQSSLPKGILGSMLSGEGEITLRVYAYASEAAQYDTTGLVKGPLLYGCKAKKSLSTFQEVPFEEEQWNTSLDLGRLFAYYKVIIAIAQKLGVSPQNVYAGAATYLSTSMAPNLLSTGLFSFLNVQLLRISRKSTEIANAIYLFNSFRIFDVPGNEYVFKQKFRGNIPILIELEINNAKCSQIAIPGFGIFNAVQLFTPENYSTSQARVIANNLENVHLPEIDSEFKLTVDVLGNPVSTEIVRIALSGAANHYVQLRLTDLSGVIIREKTVCPLSAKEIFQMPLEHIPGIYILTATDVSSTTPNVKSTRILVTK